MISRANITDQIKDGLRCPHCAYSLRGLLGDIVRCPECGNRINLTALVAGGWRDPWFRAPLFNILGIPLAWALIAPLSGMVILTHRHAGEWPPVFELLLMLSVVLAGWVAWCWFVARKFGGREGLWLSLLLHLVGVGYFVGVIGTITMAVKTFFDVGQNRWMLVQDVAGLLIFLGAIFGSRWIERFVGHRCIRRHLRLSASQGTMPK